VRWLDGRRYAVGEVLEEKLLEEGSDGSSADADEDIVDSNLSIVAVAIGIVETGDASGCEVSQNVGVVWLPVSVVPLADDYGRHGVESTGDDVTPAPVEIPRILMQKRRQQRGAEECRCDAGAISGAVALGITLEAFTVAGEVILSLLNARGDTSGEEGDGIDSDLQCELELLLAGEGRGIGDVADVEVGENADDALLHFGAYLLFSEVFLSDRVDGGPDGFDTKNNWRENQIFSGMDQNVFYLPSCEARSGDPDEVPSGRDCQEREFAGVVGRRSAGSFGFTVFQGNLRIGDDGFVGVGDGAGEHRRAGCIR
jgi:hypothetical protein